MPAKEKKKPAKGRKRPVKGSKKPATGRKALSKGSKKSVRKARVAAKIKPVRPAKGNGGLGKEFSAKKPLSAQVFGKKTFLPIVSATKSLSPPVSGPAPRFYITTAIDYPNSAPHLGHAYEKTVADCLARYHRLKGEDVFFLTGTDEHGKKIAQAAQKAGKKPKEFVDGQVESFKGLCSAWNISYDRFIRTTEPRHEDICREIFEKVQKKGDIYLGKYEGLYCTGCEAFYLEKDLSGGLCPVHKGPVEAVKEESYFFRMSKYQQHLLDFFESNPQFIYPVRRRQEIINRVKEGLKDLSVSRTSFEWGIPLRHDAKHVIYVWFDALLNYLSGVDYPSATFEKFWPADIHVIGKDILWFHAVIFPTMLFSAGLEPPKKIFVHGFINAASGEKLSKTTGNMIDPIALSSQYGADAVRYYLLREIPLGEDGNFSVESLIERHNTELADDLGNLLNRTLSLSEKKLGYTVPVAKTDEALAGQLNLGKINGFMGRLEPHAALQEIFSFVAACNKYVNEKKVWALEGKEAEQALYSLLDSLRVIAILLSPFMPQTSQRICTQLNCPPGNMKGAEFNLLEPGEKLGQKEILFKKLEPLKKEQAAARGIFVSVEKRLSDLGLNVSAAVVEGVSVKKKHEGLERKIDETLKSLDVQKISASDSVRGYLELYDALGVARQRHAIENLAEIVKNSGKIPTINTVVDSYNIVSISKGLIIGAHDLDRVFGNVSVKIADGSELFIPLGSSEKMQVPKGEYVFADDKLVLCRLDTKQGEHTKVTGATRNVFLYVQGNKRIPKQVLDDALAQACENIVKYCGGKWRKIEVKAG